MKFLLDTCAFIWFLMDSSQLPGSLKEKIKNPSNDFFLSVVSFWEMIIKQDLGKIKLPDKATLYIPQQRKKHQILNLDLDEASITHLSQLPLIHKDPFDRILICQAMEHGMTIVTPDQNIRAYPIKILWED